MTIPHILRVCIYIYIERERESEMERETLDPGTSGLSYIHQEIELDLTNGHLSVSHDRAIRYSGFFEGPFRNGPVGDFLDSTPLKTRNNNG